MVMNNKKIFSTSTTDPDFITYYDKFILPKVAEFEKKRSQIYFYSNHLASLSVPLVLLIIVITGFYSIRLVPAVMFLMVWGRLYLYSIEYEAAVRYEKLVRNEIYPIIFNYYGEAINFYPEGLLNINDTRFDGLFGTSEKTESTCFLQGTYNDITFEIVTFRYIGEKPKDTKDYESYQRLFISIPMNKSFKGRTYIERDFGNMMNSFMEKTLAAGIGCKRVKLEYSSFEEKFEVYSTDQFEARRIITPAFMERLYSMQSVFSGATNAAFYKDNFFINISCTTSTWPPRPTSKTKATFIPESEAIFRHINEICRLIDVLKLDENTRL